MGGTRNSRHTCQRKAIKRIDLFPRHDHAVFQVASHCSILPFVSFAEPCFLGPSAYLLSLGCREDSSPNVSLISLLCLTMSSVCLCPLLQQETLLSAFFLRIFEAQPPTTSVFDPKKNSCRFSYWLKF